MNVYFGTETQNGDINLEVISIQTVFKAMRLSEGVDWGTSVDNERPKD